MKTFTVSVTDDMAYCIGKDAQYHEFITASQQINFMLEFYKKNYKPQKK